MAYGLATAKNINCLKDETDLCCSVCFEEYQDSGIARKPKLLPCNHTFCYTCLSSLQELHGCLRCALCRKEHQAMNLEYLPNDASIINFLKNKDKQVIDIQKKNGGAVPKLTTYQTGVAMPSKPQQPYSRGGLFTKRVSIPANKCGFVIGKGGWSIKLIQASTGVYCYLDRNASNVDTSIFVIKGDNCDNIAAAEDRIYVRAGLRKESTISSCLQKKTTSNIYCNNRSENFESILDDACDQFWLMGVNDLASECDFEDFYSSDEDGPAIFRLY